MNNPTLNLEQYMQEQTPLQTRNGDKALVVSYDSEYEYGFRGVVIDKDGRLELVSWTRDGEHSDMGTAYTITGPRKEINEMVNSNTDTNRGKGATEPTVVLLIAANGIELPKNVRFDKISDIGKSVMYVTPNDIHNMVLYDADYYVLPLDTVEHSLSDTGPSSQIINRTIEKGKMKFVHITDTSYFFGVDNIDKIINTHAPLQLRNGAKAHIAYRIPYGNTVYPLLGVVIYDNNGQISAMQEQWTMNGKSLSEGPHDIIGLWKEGE